MRSITEGANKGPEQAIPITSAGGSNCATPRNGKSAPKRESSSVDENSPGCAKTCNTKNASSAADSITASAKSDQDALWKDTSMPDLDESSVGGVAFDQVILHAIGELSSCEIDLNDRGNPVCEQSSTNSGTSG